MYKVYLASISLRMIILLSIAHIACNSEENRQAENEIAAIFNNDTIYIREVDQVVDKQIYAQLYSIYLIRKKTVDYLINEKALDAEAELQNKKRQSLIKEYVDKNNTASNLEKYIIRNGLLNQVPDLKNDLKYLKSNTKQGEKLIYESFINELEIEYYRTLVNKSQIINYLTEPPPMKIDVENLKVNYKTKQNKTKVILITDLECERCRSTYYEYQNIINQFKGVVDFGISFYGEYVGISTLACISAGNQGMFYQMFDTLMKTDINFRDTIEYTKIAKALNLNVVKFSSDLASPNNYNLISGNFVECKRIGLFGTPSIVVNNRLLLNPGNYDYIKREIKNELVRVKDNE